MPVIMAFGVPAMQAADRRIHSLVDGLDRSMAGDAYSPPPREVFDRIQREAMLHFAFEEQYFERLGFVGTRDHAMLHRHITAQLEALVNDLFQPDAPKPGAGYGRIVRRIFEDHAVLDEKLYRTGERIFKGRGKRSVWRP